MKTQKYESKYCDYTGILYNASRYEILDSRGNILYSAKSRTVRNMKDLEERVDDFPTLYDALMKLGRDRKKGARK